MRRTLTFRAEPSVRQTDAILARIAADLARPGASVTRTEHGKLRFRMPAPWRAAHLGLLLAITSGRISVSAGSGGPRRLRYDLSFLGLQVVVVVLSIAIVGVGWRWPRLDLVGVLIAFWIVAYGIPFFTASRRFRRIIYTSARDIVERRHGARPPTPAAGTGAVPGGGAAETTGPTTPPPP